MSTEARSPAPRTHTRAMGAVLSVLAFAGFCLAAPLAAQDTPPIHTSVTHDPVFEEIRAHLIGLVESGTAPSMAVAVAHKGRIVWEEAIGWADRESRTAATPETVYMIGSMSKSVTATGVMVLVERGVVDLDDPVERYLPEGALSIHEGRSADLTIRTVMQMGGGIPHGSETYVESIDPPTILDYLTRAGIIVFEPGEVDHYSNNAYGVLEAVIEGATGVEFSEFMESNVFSPLAMSNTYGKLYPELVGRATGLYGQDGEKHEYYQFMPTGGAGMFASVHDVILYGLFHLGQTRPEQEAILDAANLDIMHLYKDPGRESITALGWGSAKLDSGRTWLITNGSVRGANSMLTLVPDEELAVAVLTNVSSSSMADESAVMIADAALPGFAQEAMGMIQTYEAENAPAPLEPNSDLGGSWRGSIESRDMQVPVTITVSERGDATVAVGAEGRAESVQLSQLRDMVLGEFTGTIPGHRHFGGEASVSLMLRRKGNRLYGHATWNAITADGSRTTPLYVRLKKGE